MDGNAAIPIDLLFVTWAKLGFCMAHFPCGGIPWELDELVMDQHHIHRLRFLRGCPRSRRLVFRRLAFRGPQLYGIRGICRNHPQVKSSLPMEAKVVSFKNRMYSRTGRTPRNKMTATGKGGVFTAGAKGKGGLDGLNMFKCRPLRPMQLS